MYNSIMYTPVIDLVLRGCSDVSGAKTKCGGVWRGVDAEYFYGACFVVVAGRAAV